MHVLELSASVAAAGSATTVRSGVIDLGARNAPFLPGYSAVTLLCLRALANATAQIRGQDADPILTTEEAEAVGTTESDGDFVGALDNGNIVPGTVVITADTIELRDDGNGVLVDQDESPVASGTINYDTGAIVLADAGNEEAVVADYQWNEYDELADVQTDVTVTTAETSRRFSNIAVLPRFIEVSVVTPSTNGAGTISAYLLGH